MFGRPTTTAAATTAAAVLAVTGLTAGCGSSAAITAVPSTAGSPGAYVSAVDELLQPPGRMAVLASDQMGADHGPLPPREEVEDLVDDAQRELAELRALDIRDPGLAAQRDHLTLRYGVVLARMRDVARALTRGDRIALRAVAPPFFASIRSLPSAVADTSTRSSR